MARLPKTGADKGNWGAILNDYLSQSLSSTGTLKPNTVTSTAIAAGAITKTTVGLANVDNTSDVAKPISTATQTALNAKQTKSTLAADVATQVNAASVLQTAIDNRAARTFKPTTFGEIMRPYPNSLMPTSRATVTVSDTAPTWWASSGYASTVWSTSGAYTFSGPPTQASPGTDEYGCLFRTAGGDSLKPVDFEFVIAAEKFIIIFGGEGVIDLRIWIDGNPVTPSSVTFSASSGIGIAEVVFPSFTSAKIRFAGPPAFIRVGHLPNATVKAAPAPYTLGVISDSYYEINSDMFARSPGIALRNETGFRIWNMAQGSTGYVNDAGGAGGRSAYTSTDRIARLTSAPIDALLVNGTGNDGAVANAAAYKAIALAYFAQVAIAKPGLPIIVVGIEPVSAFRSAHGQDLNDGLRAAASEAPNVVGFIDPYSEQWLTGTGDTAHVTGDGNQDFLISGVDRIHLNANGSEFWQKLVASRMAAFSTEILLK